MTTPELTRTPNRTEDQARSDIAASDRRSWFPGTRALGEYGIMSGRGGREIARFKARYDRDSVVAMARAFDDMRQALERILEEDNDGAGQSDGNFSKLSFDLAKSALLKASAVKP